MKNARVLIADDEPEMLRVLEIMLGKMGLQVAAATDGRAALDAFVQAPADLVITDLRMPRMDGIALLDALRRQGADVPVVVITAHGSVESAVAAMKRGASDYLQRPFDIDELEAVVRRVLGASELQRDNEFLRQQVQQGWGDFAGDSTPMRAVYDAIRRAGPTGASVLLVGETGSGKELAAHALHAASPRANRLLVAINCAAIPADMLESELFGYVRGAFTGAVKDRAGKFEYADGGTVFLDEITEMALPLQAKLLRVIEDGRIERLGANGSKAIDVRFIAATNMDPEQAVRENRLRGDLYFRLNVLRIDLPPLRDRVEDIPGLVAHFLRRLGRDPARVRLGAGTLEKLQGYNWPGNVRELANMVERAVILGTGDELDDRSFVLPTQRAESAQPGASAGPLGPAIEHLESTMIADALRQAEGNKARAAALLDISERTLWYKIRKYGLSSA
jgi:two-component system response regulator AtoC